MKAGGGKRALLRAIVASLTATALLAIGILLFGHFGQTEGRILITTILLAGYGLLALPAGFLFDQGHLPVLASTVLGLAAAAFAVNVALVWTGIRPPRSSRRHWRRSAPLPWPRPRSRPLRPAAASAIPRLYVGCFGSLPRSCSCLR